MEKGEYTSFTVGAYDDVLRLQGRLCVPDVDGLRQELMVEAHSSKYSVHRGSTKMYKYLKAKHKRPCGLAQNIEIPLWKWEMINMDFVKSFQEGLGTRVNLCTAFHAQTDAQAERTIQILEETLQAYAVDFGDGSSRGNPGPSGGGGILRNSQGHMISAFAAPFGLVFNNNGEALAILIGIEWCLSHNYMNIVVESDSLLAVYWIVDIAKPPWDLADTINNIKAISNSFDSFKIQHCFREGNKIVD
ncbi:uncharacterized protein LOC132624241 [Lycium barbarum]|uniref:uncharacterized protein LOC132624241 n=1 Tax=Lycium barbarum TaxID=112863 RepID=UPI00293E45DD|nr:uncharacterized protein LOC132624241 [Lycium barbarum]